MVTSIAFVRVRDGRSNVRHAPRNLLRRIAGHDVDFRIGKAPAPHSPFFQRSLHRGKHLGQGPSAGIDQVQERLGGVVMALRGGCGGRFEEGDVVVVFGGEDERGGEADGAGSDDDGVFSGGGGGVGEGVGAAREVVVVACGDQGEEG
mmetsp:Transcript_25762/g.54202  ORF Transcript_25762/g.54202 Transcript_25762/m.54202 type:complete len:148 (+) Transcript_25762:1654-2097(+)